MNDRNSSESASRTQSIQYESLEAPNKTCSNTGLVALGFPSNDVAGQKPGTEKEIQDFCRLTYGVRFPLFAKTSVKTSAADPLYTGLAKAAGRYPKWNSNKYIIDREGRLVGDFLSATSPKSRRLIEAMEALL